MTDKMPDNYTVLDIETTGLSPQADEIIELSALKIRDNKVVREFSSLVNPERSINDFISNLTGITNVMLSNAPKIKEVLPDFINFIEDDIILGHNVNFDIGFIRAKLRNNFNEELHNLNMDTMRIAKNTLKLPNYKLTTIAKHYGIDTKNNHRGLKDCYIAFEVYNNLTGKTEPEVLQQSLF